MELLNLFLAFLQIGALSFGGGYASIPLIQEQAITKYGWLTLDEFTDLVAIAEMTPGPIAVNAATFVGNNVAGFIGGLVATLAVILPSCIFVTVIASLYFKYRSLKLMQGVLTSLRPAVISMIMAAGVTILLPLVFGNVTSLSDVLLKTDYRAVVWFILGFIAIKKFKANPIAVMLMTGALELVCSLILKAF